MIKDTELIALEKDRQEESDYVLQKINLLNILNKYGEVNIVGAKALGLMVAKDIDISVVVEKIDYGAWKKLVAELMTTPEVRKVTAIDYYNYDEQNRFNPKSGQKYSLYVETDSVIGKNDDKFDVWSCQIHLIEKKVFLSKNIDEIRNLLTPDKRMTILRIKYWANQINKLLLQRTGGHFKIQSTVIYPLVLSGDVCSIDDFVKAFLPSVPSEYREIFEGKSVFAYEVLAQKSKLYEEKLALEAIEDFDKDKKNKKLLIVKKPEDLFR